MKGRPVDQLVYEQMFPKPRASDPQNFHALLQRHLILEVRQEVHNYYGHLETQEAKYPGLDYCHATHRVRLGRYTWHRRLFRAFDALRLTPAEIAGLTKWEGTRWAKERFEREQGYRIRDTTADEFADWIEPELRPQRGYASRAVSQETEQGDETTVAGSSPSVAEENSGVALQMVQEDGDDSDEDFESVGIALNERLRERVARNNNTTLTASAVASVANLNLSSPSASSNISSSVSNVVASTPGPAAAATAGASSSSLAGAMGMADWMPLDEEWEQWLKNAIETGEFPHVAEQIARSSGGPNADRISPDDLFPSRMLASARAGQWHEIPDFLVDMIRSSLAAEEQYQHRRRLLEARAPRAPPAYHNPAQSYMYVSSAPRAPTQGQRAQLRPVGSSVAAVAAAAAAADAPVRPLTRDVPAAMAQVASLARRAPGPMGVNPPSEYF